MADKTTLRFWLRTDRPNKDGTAPVHLIYSIKGQRKYTSVPGATALPPHNWDAKTQRAVYRDKKAAKQLFPDIPYTQFLFETEIKNYNSNIEAVIREVTDIEKLFRLQEVAFTHAKVFESLKKLKKSLATKEAVPVQAYTITDFISRFVEDSTTSHKPGTLKVYTGLKAHLKAFNLKSKVPLDIDKLDMGFFKSLQSYFGEIEMNNTTAAKQISTLKTLIKYARRDYKFTVHPDYLDYQFGRKDGDNEVIALTRDEFNKILEFDLSGNNRLEKVRDIFVFACTSGLRFSDLTQLKWLHVREHELNFTMIKGTRKHSVPLNDFTKFILAKYKGNATPLPMISGQKLNDYIKELGKLAGIDTEIEKVRKHGAIRKSEIFKKYELMSIHMGRRTFASLSLSSGINTQTTMALGGWKKYESFKRYVSVDEEQKQAAMKLAWAVPAAKELTNTETTI